MSEEVTITLKRSAAGVYEASVEIDGKAAVAAIVFGADTASTGTAGADTASTGTAGADTASAERVYWPGLLPPPPPPHRELRSRLIAKAHRQTRGSNRRLKTLKLLARIDAAAAAALGLGER